MAESAIHTRLAARASTMPCGICTQAADIDPRRLPRRTAAVMMGDIGEEITEIELEPPPEETPAEPPAEPAMEPVPG